MANQPQCSGGLTFVCTSGGAPGCQSGIPGCVEGSNFFAGSCTLIQPFCSFNIPRCPTEYEFVCSSGGIPTCELLNLPACKFGNDFFAGICQLKEFLITDQADFLEVISTPKLPNVIQLPLVRDEFIGKIGISYPGANPSFEIKTTLPLIDLNITSISLEDSDDVLYENIPFKITEIPQSTNSFILTLSLPDDISLGESRFTLNLGNGKTLTGIIEIIDSLDVEIVTIMNHVRKLVAKPEIKRIYVKKVGRKITLGIRGKNFVNRKILFTRDEPDNLEKFVNPQIPDPHTAVTIYPSTIDSMIKARIVRKRSKYMKIRFVLPQNVSERTDAVLVVATPEGIVSVNFPITRKSKKFILAGNKLKN